MLSYIDPHTGEFVWQCPHCGESIRSEDLPELENGQEDGACEGCLARELFEGNPEMISFAVDMWARSDSWPGSSVWMEAIPPSGISVLGADYHEHRLHLPRRRSLLSWTAD